MDMTVKLTVELPESFIAGLDRLITACEIIAESCSAKADSPAQQEGEKNAAFVPPSVEEVRQYCKANSLTVDPYRFVEYYAKRNWIDRDGKPLAEWPRVADAWQRRETARQTPPPRSADPLLSSYTMMHDWVSRGQE